MVKREEATWALSQLKRHKHHFKRCGYTKGFWRFFISLLTTVPHKGEKQYGCYQTMASG